MKKLLISLVIGSMLAFVTISAVNQSMNKDTKLNKTEASQTLPSPK